eukprot:gene1185-1258_t
METFAKELPSDPTIQQILKNLSTPQQNWSSFISDIEETYNSANLSHVKTAALSCLNRLFISKSISKISKESTDETDFKKVLSRFPTSIAGKESAEDFSRVLKYLLDSASLNADNELYSFLIQLPLFSKAMNNKNEKTGSPSGGKSLMTNGPLTLSSSELLEFMKYCLSENSIVWYLLLLKILFAIESRWLSLTDHFREDTTCIIEHLGKGEMLSEKDIKQIVARAKHKEHLKSFQSLPRILLLSGNSNKCIRYEIQGKAAGLMLGVVAPSHFRFMYYEATLKEKDSKLKGVRIGWAMKSASLVDNLNLGDGDDSWIFDFEASRFLHSEYIKMKQDTKSDQNLAAKQTFSEQLLRSLSAKSFDLDQDSMLGGLFVDGKTGTSDKSALVPEQAQGKVEHAPSFDSFQDKEIDDSGTDGLQLEVKKEKELNQLIDWSHDSSLTQKISTIGCALDCTTGVIYYFNDGVYLGKSPTAIDIVKAPIPQLVAAFACGPNIKIEINVGTSPFKFGHVVLDELRTRCAVHHQIPDFNDFQTVQTSFITTSLALNQESDELEEAVTKKEDHESSCILVQNVCTESLKTFTFEMSFKIGKMKTSEMILFCCSPVLSGVIMHGLELEEQAAKIGVERDGHLFFDLYNCERLRAVKVTIDEWQHSAITYTFHRSSGKANVVFLLNGSVAFTTEIPNGKNNKPGKVHPRQVCIGGCMQNFAVGFEGEISNIRLWSSAKSLERISPFLSRSKLMGNESDLLVFLPLEEGTGNIVRDYNTSKSSARKSEILTIRGHFRWILQPHQVLDDEPVQYFLDNVSDLDADSRNMLDYLNISRQSFLQSLTRKVFIGTEKMASQSSHIFNFQCSLPTAKAIISREPIALTLLHSVFIDLIRFNETEEKNENPQLTSLLLAILNLLELHVIRISDDLTSAAAINHEIRSKLFINALYFICGPSNLTSPFADILRIKAANFLVNQLDFFFQDRLSPLRLIVILLEIENKSQDSMSVTLRRALSNSSSDKSVFFNSINLDPLPVISCIGASGRILLLKSLFSKLTQSTFLSEVIGPDLRPFRFDLNKGMLVFKKSIVTENSKKRPYLGGIVKRGPDWHYGDEDGGESSYGVILRVGDADPHKGVSEVTVGWKNGFIESYRYDFNQISFDRKIYDIEIVSSCEFEEELTFLKGFEAEGNNNRRILSFTPLDVFNVLIGGQSSDTINKRNILAYIKEVAPPEWQENRDLVKSIQALVLKLSAAEICNLYREFYESFSLKIEKQNPLSFINAVSPIAASGKYGLLKELFKQLLRYVSRRDISKQDEALNFLATCQYLLFIGNDFDSSAEIKLYEASADICTEFSRELSHAKFIWDWSHHSLHQTAPDVNQAVGAKNVLNQESKQEGSSTVIKLFTFDKHNVSENMQIRHRSRCIDISLIGDREWNTLTADQGLEYEKGIFRWYIRVKFSERRSHFMIGLCTSEVNPDEFLGHDGNSWGFSHNLEHYHGGVKKRLSSDGAKITPGSILEIAYNSYLGTFGLIEITPDAVNVLIDSEKCVLENINGRPLYPAISLFTPGDTVSLLTDSSDISAARTKVLMVQSSSSTTTIKSSQIINLGTPNEVVTHYLLNSLESLQDLLDRNSFVEDWPKYENLLPLITHSIAQFIRWACPTIEKEFELRQLCISNLQLIGLTLLEFQKLEKEEVTKLGTIWKNLQLLVLLILCLISRLVEGLMQNHKFLSLHRIERSNEKAKIGSSVDESNELREISRSVSLKNWIDNPLFASGLKSELGNVEESIRSIRGKEPKFELFFRWLACFDRTHPNFRKVGGDRFDICVKTLFLSIVYSCGLLGIIESLKDILSETVDKLGKIEGSLEEYFVKHLKAPPVLVRIWELSMKLKTWGKDTNAVSQITYEQLASKWYDRIIFSFKLHPTLQSLSFRLSTREISNCLSQINSLLRSNFDLENWARENFSLLQKFIVDDVSTEGLEAFCKIIDAAGKKRSEGFIFIKKVLDVLSFDACNGFKAVFVDAIAVLLKGYGVSWSFGNPLVFKSRAKGWHYADGLSGISGSVKADLKTSFNSVFSILISEVADVPNSFHFYKLALLNSLAIRVADDDHELLMRVNFFPVLKDLLDENLTDEAENGKSARLIAVTMKIFIWMALQVASTSSETEMEGKLQNLNSSIKLQKVLSGPGTLSDAVFDTLFKLLSDWSLQSDVASKTISLESATLLHYVSRNERCMKILRRQEWIELLVQLVCFSEMDCKLKCLLILGEALVGVSPINLNVNLSTFLRKFQINTSNLFEGSSATIILQLMLYLSGQLLFTPSIPKNDARLMTLGVISEAVALIRKLFEQHTWFPIVEDLIFNNLSTFETELSDQKQFNEVSKYVLVGTLFTLGGQFDLFYPSQPVLLKTHSTLTVGIVKSIHEINNQIEISAFKLKSIFSLDNSKLHGDEVEQIILNPDQLYSLERSPFQASFISSRVLSKLILIANLCCVNLDEFQEKGKESAESKDEEAVIEEKTESDCSGFDNKGFFSTYLFSILLKIFEEMSQNSCVRGLELKQLIETLDWSRIVDLAQSLTSTLGCHDIRYYHEYLTGSISYLTMKKPLKANTELNVEESKVRETVIRDSERLSHPLSFGEETVGEDIDPALIDSLESMGFQRKLCIAALRLRGFDPTEALNYLLCNGSELLESLNAENGSGMPVHSENVDMEWELPNEEKSETAEAKFDSNNPTVFHCSGNTRKFLPFYSEPSFESERLGCVFPGDDIGVVEEKIMGDNTWYRLSFSDFDGNNYHSTYGDEIYEIYVWVPRILNGEVMVEPGSYDGEAETEFNEPKGDSLQIDRYYRIIGSNGALARDGIEITSNEVASLSIGDIVHACEESFNSEGTIRLRLDSPVNGWISKIFGLVEQISVEIAREATSKRESKEVTLISDKSETIEVSEQDRLEKIEDSLEVLTGTDVYVRDDRFFGHRQGFEYSFFLNDDKADIQAIQARRNRVAAVKGQLEYFTDNFRTTWPQVEIILKVLLKLRARRLLSILMVRASSNVEDFHFFLHKCNELHNLLGTKFPEKLHRVIRLLVFRVGGSRSRSETELLASNQISYHAGIGKGKCLEDSVGSIIKNLVEACDAKYADNSWTDLNFDDDVDSDVFQQPNVQFSAWASEIVMRTGDVEYLKRLLLIWIRTVRGSSVSLKTIAFSVLASILRYLRVHAVSNTEETARFVFGVIPVRRLSRFASKRLWQELEDSPAFSRFIQSFVHFMGEVEITLNQWKLSSTCDEVSRETSQSNTHSKIGLLFDKPDSYVQLYPAKDIAGSWTFEVTLRRRKVVSSQFISGNFPTEKENVNPRLGNTKPVGEKLGISKLLKLLLGTSAVKPNSEPETKITIHSPEDLKEKLYFHPSYLVSSSKSFIKIQRGGRDFIADDVNDPLQNNDFVNCEALCLSYGQGNGEEKSFDFIVPYDAWFKISLVCDTSTGYMNLYINGKFIDSQQGVISFPISTIGSNKINHTLTGEVVEFKIWPFAKTACEIEQRSDDNSLINLKFDAGLNFGLYDSRGYLTACKSHGCRTAQITDFDLDESYLAGASLTTVESFDFELTGNMTVKAVPAFGSPLNKGINEIITIFFKRSGKINQNGNEEIYGHIDWVERNVQTLCVGEVFEDKVLIKSSAQQLVRGAPERISWLEDFILEGALTSGNIKASCNLLVKDTSVFEEWGLLKLDSAKQPPEVIVLSKNKQQISLEVKKEASDGQYVIIFEVNPFPKIRDNLAIVDLSLYGIVSQQGSYWIDFTIRANSGSIAFGFCTADALTHPDSCVEANDGTWAYSIGGSASNGANLFECDTAEENDVITLHLNTFNGGFVHFFKNRKLLAAFDFINSRSIMNQVNDPAFAGIRPFVSLANPTDCVEYNGIAKEGPITLFFGENDSLGRFKLLSFLLKGSIQGYGLLSVKNDTEWWFGKWDKDFPIGYHVRLDNIQISDFQIQEVKLYTGTSFHEIGEPSNFSEILHEEIKKDFTIFKDHFPEVFHPSVIPESTPNVTSHSTMPEMEMPSGFVSVTFIDTESGDSPNHQLGLQDNFSPLLSQYSVQRGFPRASFIFQYNGISISDDSTPSSLGMTGSGLITVLVKSHNCSIEKFGDPVAQYFPDSDAHYVLMIVYEGGATVRNGIEIEESSSLRTLKQGDVLEAFRKEQTNEGIGRFRIADGWISEKLRGGTESPVSLVLREKFENPRKYRVIREDGAKVRADASLESDDKGICPQDTIVTVTEKRLVHFNDSAPTSRLKIIEPIEWIGWISDKPHLLEEIRDNNDPEFEMELRRRNRVRANRKMRKNMTNIESKSQPFFVRVKGNASLSSETFFLLQRNRFTESIHFSDDLQTISCPDSSSGRCLVLGSRGFSHGVHYWEVQVNNASWGSVFIGVAPEDAVGWNGFGFINYRAVQAFGSETLYGSYFGVGDKIGVLLDMDRGTLSFFKDGEDFNVGKVVVINMGIAYHNVRKTAARHSSSSTLYPCFGMKNSSDQLSISNSHWISEEGVNSTKYLQNILTFSQTMQNWIQYYESLDKGTVAALLFTKEVTSHLYEEYLEKLAIDEFYVESRPGIMVKIKSGISEFSRLLGESFIKEYNIFPGVVVNTVYGKATLLGISGERLWYSCERNLKKAWYWLGHEFKELMQTARMTVSYINDMVEINSLPISNTEMNQNPISRITQEEFQTLLINLDWNINQDAALTKAINRLAYQLDQNPLYLSLHSVQNYFNSHKIHQLSSKSMDEIILRFIALCYLNRGIMVILPLVDLSSTAVSHSLLSTNITTFEESKDHSSVLISLKDSILHVKACIFTFIKTDFWNTVVTETTSPTTPPPDEYERPDEIREISINRIQARDAIRRKDQLHFLERIKLSVFGQLMEGIQHWDSRAYRRSYIHMQDAGQPRAFFVRFVGEGVDDQGGPYRAVFQTAIGEEVIQLLSLIVPSANARDEIGDHRDRYVFNTTSSEFQENAGKIFIHLGKIVGIACRHKILLPLPFAPLIWKALTQTLLDISDLQSIESSVLNSLQQIPSYLNEMTPDQIYDLLVQALLDCNTSQEIRILPEKARYVVKNAIRKEELYAVSNSEDQYNLQSEETSISDQKRISSSLFSTDEISYGIVDIIQLIQYLHLTSQNRLLQYFFEGLSYVLPVEIMPIFTSEELEVLFSGENTVDLEVLKKATEYESVTAHDSHIQYFWKALELMNSDERSQFINFCSGRSRLPTSASEFPMAFKLTAPPANASKNPDNYLPIARTCFFSLSLPQYSSLEICLAKLKYAISNTELMDADFIDRRGTSGWENIR